MGELTLEKILAVLGVAWVPIVGGYYDGCTVPVKDPATGRLGLRNPLLLPYVRDPTAQGFVDWWLSGEWLIYELVVKDTEVSYVLGGQ